MRRVHTYLPANWCPNWFPIGFQILGSQIGVRANCQLASRLVRETGVIEGLAKKVKIECRIADFREGRGDWQYSQGSGGFSYQCGSNRFRATGTAYLCDLAQAFLHGSPGFITYVGRIAISSSPFLNSQEKKRAMQENTNRIDSTQGRVGTQHVPIRCAIFRLCPQTQGRPIVKVRVRNEFDCVTWTTYSFQATPLRGRSCPR